MSKRFVTIWFHYLKADWFTRRRPDLKEVPFVVAAPERGRMIITAVNNHSTKLGIMTGDVVADARAIYPGLQVLDDRPLLSEQLLKKFAEFCIRFTPVTAVDLPDGIILDATGCAHLWGSEEAYLTDIHNRLKILGYETRIAIADTIGTAWAITHFGKNENIVQPGNQKEVLLQLNAAALRPEVGTLERLNKLGLRTINSFIGMPRSALRRRFGDHLLLRIDQALGFENEAFEQVLSPEPYHERLPCLEPIVTATGIAIALQQLLEKICSRLQKENKGLRNAILKSYRIDGKIIQTEIGTNRPSHHINHLFKLFEMKLGDIEPALGIELFTLDALKVEEASPVQENLWTKNLDLDDFRLTELMDRIAGKIGSNQIHRFLADEHYWPERSIREAKTFQEKPAIEWNLNKPRPIQLLPLPVPVEVTAPIPDYPPMLFRYKGILHKIKKADGPERIEREWWLDDGPHRDYYAVEDEEGRRYWLFRSGHYSADNKTQWFLHGFFA